jgi:hypothetical protein
MLQPGKTIILAGEEYEIKPLNVKKTFEVIASIEKVPNDLGAAISSENNIDFMALISGIASNLDILGRPIVTAVNDPRMTTTKLTDELSLLEVYDLIEALLEVNQAEKLFKRVKKNKVLGKYLTSPSKQ